MKITWNKLEELHPELKTLRESEVWNKPEINPGWHFLIDELMCKLKELDMLTDEFKVVQVKQKFGELRFYIKGLKPEGYNIVADYEIRSSYVCEDCGEEGMLRDDMYKVVTLCDKCLERR